MILVWIETFDGAAKPTSWEALGAAKQLAASLNTSVSALVLGRNAATIAEEAGKRGASKAFACEDATFEPFRLEPSAALLTKLVQDEKPTLVLAVATSAARELLASSAADTESGMISDAIELAVEDGAVKVTRPVYAGKILSDVLASGTTSFLTLRARAFKPAEPGDSSAELVTLAPVLSEDQISTKIEHFEAEVGKVSLTDAAIIVSGGRGMANNPKEPPAGYSGDPAVWKAQDGFHNVLQPLVDVLGGALGASRAAVDAGYIPYAHQVGQTGKTVSPDLYIACAISGAIQHQAGMRSSKVIVAINKDKEAPIFKMARYGLVGDVYAIVPALTKALKERLGK